MPFLTPVFSPFLLFFWLRRENSCTVGVGVEIRLAGVGAMIGKLVYMPGISFGSCDFFSKE